MLLSYFNGSVGVIWLLIKGEGEVEENRRLLARKRERKKTLYSLFLSPNKENSSYQYIIIAIL